MKTTERSLRWLKKRRTCAALVERRLPHTFTTVDAFGFVDILAMDEFDGALAVQACGATDVQPHLRKIEAEPRAVAWLHRKNRLEVHGWRKLRRGTKAWRWVPRIIKAHLDAGAIRWHEVGSPEAGEEEAK